MIQLDNHHGDRRKKKHKKRYPGCLAQAVNGMFYSVISNLHQPQYTYNVGGGEEKSLLSSVAYRDDNRFLSDKDQKRNDIKSPILYKIRSNRGKNIG